MTDLAPDAAGFSGSLTFNPDQVGSMREHWVTMGLDAAAFDAAAAGEAVQGIEGGEGDDIALLSSTPTLTPAQAQEMAAALLAAGVPQERVEAALREDGLAVPAEDARTDEQKAFDANLGPAAPEDYRVDYMGRTPPDLLADLPAFHALGTGWLNALGFPELIGPAVLERTLDVCQWLENAEQPAR